ncbi:MAG: hypothetical protein JO085_06105 [Acidimicrobiia bacterium]|nr:hypothetical protein [Acidimicrobiia bacterium]
MLTRRTLTALVLSLVVVVAPSHEARAQSASGVSPGSPVTVRANPDNAIVAATRQAAAAVGLGSVSAVGFSPDCSPVSGAVVVCRNPSLHKGGARAVTLVGPNSCVVRTAPSVGGDRHGVNVMTKALRKCLA